MRGLIFAGRSAPAQAEKRVRTAWSCCRVSVGSRPHTQADRELEELRKRGVGEFLEQVRNRAPVQSLRGRPGFSENASHARFVGQEVQHSGRRR